MLDRHAVAILCGGYTSHARYASHVGLSVHSALSATVAPARVSTCGFNFQCSVTGLGRIPTRAAQRLIAWPSGLSQDESSDLALLRHLARVRSRELDMRYGRSD